MNPIEPSPAGMSRRQFLRAAALGAGLTAAGMALPWTHLPLGLASANQQPRAFEITSGAAPSTVFPQGIASGDPTPTGAIVWTRVRPEAAGDVALEVASDPSFREPIYRGVVPAAEINAASDHTLRVDLDGLLSENRYFYYRFICGGTASRTGRLRTLPAADADIDRLRLGVLTCQNFQHGYFPAYGHIADADVDFLVHLGDFIYEHNGEASYAGTALPGRAMDLPSGGPRMETAADLSYVHQRYRSDEHLQRALEQHTIITTWDDHEITDNCYFNYEEGRYYGGETFRLNDDEAALTAYFAACAKAYVEYMPIRVRHDATSDNPQDHITLYRRFSFGKLVDLWMLDERWFRSTPPPGEERLGPNGPNRLDPEATMLGPRQRDWLTDGLVQSDRHWKVVGNPVQMTPLGFVFPGTSIFLGMDSWDGYEHERRLVADAMAQTDNVVVLTGDLHTFQAGYVQTGYNDRLADQRVAVELMTPAISSPNMAEAIYPSPYLPGEEEVVEAAVLLANPHLRMWNSHRYGYSVVEFTKSEATYSGYIVDKNTTHLPGNNKLFRVLRVPAGRVEIEDLHYDSPTGFPIHPAGLLNNIESPTAPGPGVKTAGNWDELRALAGHARHRPPVPNVEVHDVDAGGTPGA